MNNKKTVAIDIASFLKVKPADIDKFIKVAIGDSIEVDAVLAEKKSFMGVNRIKVCSPIEGIVDSFDFKEGQVVLEVDEELIIPKEEEKKDNTELTEKQSSQKQEKKAVFTRKSKKEKEKDKKEAKKKDKEELTNVELDSLFGFGTFSGKGVLINNFKADKLDFSHENKIVICSKMPEVEAFYKGSVLGLAGFICNSYKLKKAKKIEEEVNGKVRAGLLVLADKYDIEKLDGKKIFVEEGKLVVN